MRSGKGGEQWLFEEKIYEGRAGIKSPIKGIKYNSEIKPNARSNLSIGLLNDNNKEFQKGKNK
jgi:hypothetical protein